MSKLVEELKEQHKAITEVLNKVRDLGIGSPEGRKLLASAKAGLLQHLKKEDKELYPLLREKAKSDEKLKRLMESFASDMDAISAAVTEFFNKYESGGSGLEFAKDFGRIFVILGGRIKKEEDILYKEYDKLVSEQK